MLYMDFWSHLIDDQPDLGKMHDLGSKISLTVNMVEEVWIKL